LLLFPIQIFPQGTLQIADFIILIGIFIVLISKGLSIDNLFLKSTFIFVCYSLLVGSYFAIYYQDFDFLKNPFNYLYCFLILIFIADLNKNNVFLKVSLFSLFCSILIQIILFFKVGLNIQEGRFMIMFQNPNQLGFWALNVILFQIIIFINLQKTHLLSMIIIFLSSVFFVFVSLSQAAILSLFVLFVVLALYLFKFYKLYFIPLFILFFILIYNTHNSFSSNIFYENVQNRIENDLLNENDNDNSFEARNYTRLIDYPQYLLLGSGEGKVSRFGNMDLNEIHSTFANIIFSYGIIGFVIYFFSFIEIYKYPFSFYSILLTCYFLFTLTHNTLRWPLFWVLPYLFYTYNKKHVRNKRYSF
jgi:hypothetical protein